ncbi:hypothetical protein E2C01_054680 [Portunus trituberculatus]|uniref:Secreted protein n=1 Tax=Portunus trituberculatus TaxID=210409 RepID=A0A5B7GTX8_PORTR|nr:hypothetical protein [Portunus trituberculatus]
MEVVMAVVAVLVPFWSSARPSGVTGCKPRVKLQRSVRLHLVTFISARLGSVRLGSLSWFGLPQFGSDRVGSGRSLLHPS